MTIFLLILIGWSIIGCMVWCELSLYSPTVLVDFLLALLCGPVTTFLFILCWIADKLEK